MNRILRCDWLTERARWSYLARSVYGHFIEKDSREVSLSVHYMIAKFNTQVKPKKEVSCKAYLQDFLFPFKSRYKA